MVVAAYDLNPLDMLPAPDGMIEGVELELAAGIPVGIEIADGV